MRKHGENKTIRIMMATVPHDIAWAGRTKYQADGFYSTECTWSLIDSLTSFSR